MRAEEIFLNLSWMARGNILYVAAAPGGNSPPYLAHFTCLRTVLRFVTYLHTGKAVSFDRYCSKLGSVMSYREILTFSLGVPVIILHISFWVWNYHWFSCSQEKCLPPELSLRVLYEWFKKQILKPWSFWMGGFALHDLISLCVMYFLHIVCLKGCNRHFCHCTKPLNSLTSQIGYI